MSLWYILSIYLVDGEDLEWGVARQIHGLGKFAFGRKKEHATYLYDEDLPCRPTPATVYHFLGIRPSRAYRDTGCHPKYLWHDRQKRKVGWRWCDQLQWWYPIWKFQEWVTPFRADKQNAYSVKAWFNTAFVELDRSFLMQVLSCFRFQGFVATGGSTAFTGMALERKKRGVGGLISRVGNEIRTCLYYLGCRNPSKGEASIKHHWYRLRGST